jgi:inorganic pyrophosphatase/exopolyphosphatase
LQRSELIKLRKLVKEELDKRERIKELLKSDLLSEYLSLTGEEKTSITNETLEDIIERVLKTFKITKTNGIYVCTSAYYVDCKICYEDTEYYTYSVDIDNKFAEYKTYNDIENDRLITAVREKEYDRPLIKDFERNNIVLNPYNKEANNNGYKEVRNEFFKNAIKYGEAKSKKLILSKYPRINNDCT